MSRKFIATVLAASMTLTGFAAAPAKADSDDLARALGTAATIAIIGNALANAERGRAQVHVDSTPRRHYNAPPLPRRYEAPRQHRKAILPRACLREVQGRKTNYRYVMGARCLERSGFNTHNMPRSCRVSLSTYRGTRPGYIAGCLRDRGYGIEGYGGRSTRWDHSRDGRWNNRR